MSTKPTEWLDLLHKASADLGTQMAGIENLAQAFERVGQTQPARELAHYAAAMERIQHQIDKATGLMVKQTVDTAGAMDKAVLEAALAGATIASRGQSTEPCTCPPGTNYPNRAGERRES